MPTGSFQRYLHLSALSAVRVRIHAIKICTIAARPYSPKSTGIMALAQLTALGPGRSILCTKAHESIPFTHPCHPLVRIQTDQLCYARLEPVIPPQHTHTRTHNATHTQRSERSSSEHCH
ncbi:hypothetical protein Mapa_009730 [Marchantia paleacea]|nr:hypothetical protein Mapa_009730 [Marchantia paleacea]